MPKTLSRFAAWQEANQIRREGIIDEYLAFLAKTKVKPPHTTALADLVAKHIAHVEDEPCNKATLLRNVRYKAKLLSFQARSLASGSKSLSPRTVTDPTAKALITTSQLETGNLRRELDRLNIYVTSLEQQVDRFKSQGRHLPSSTTETKPDELVPDGELRFLRTCQALRTLVAHLHLVVELDVGKRAILDKSRRRNNVIVDQEIAGPFFEWLTSLPGSEK